MTEQEMRDWVEANFQEKLREFGLGWWRVDLTWGRASDPNHAMECSSKPEYEQSFVTIDIEQCKQLTLEQFVDCIEHELMHIIHAPFGLFWDMVLANVHKDHHDSIQTSWSHAAELTVRHLERMKTAMRAAGNKK